MDNDRRQIVETRVGVGISRAGEVPQQILGHVQAVQRELDERVHLGPRALIPSESLDVETEYGGESSDAELFGARLLRLAALAVNPLTIVQLFGFDKFFQAIVDIADGRGVLPVPLLPDGAREGGGNVDGQVKKRIVGFACVVTREARDTGLQRAAKHGGYHGV